MLRTAALRVLGRTDLSVALELLDRDPVQNVFVAARLGTGGLDPWRLGAEVWGYPGERGRLAGLCYSGANLVPAVAPGAGAELVEDALHAFAERARRLGRRCSSVVGPAELVAPLWAQLQPAWSPAREVRPCQPVLALSAPPRVPADPLVRRVRPEEIDALLPAAIAMFTEEVGVSPLAGGGGGPYRSRVAELVHAGRAFARFEDGRVVFKAEIGAVTPYAAQVQGVWVPPDRRGEGLSVGGMASVVEYALAGIAGTVTLYVNDYNLAARAAYRRVGFAEVGTSMTVLF